MKAESQEGRFWPEKLVGIAVGRAYLYGTITGLSAGIVLGILIFRLIKGI